MGGEMWGAATLLAPGGGDSLAGWACFLARYKLRAVLRSGAYGPPPHVGIES